MAFRLRTIDPTTRFADLLSIDLFAQLLPQSQILAILHTTRRRERRVRKLSQAVIVWLIIAMNIWTHVSLAHVFQKLARGLRFVWPDPTLPWPTAGALCRRRYQLGVQPLALLFHQRCQPLATPATPGAFLFGYRLMAIDSTVEIMADTPSNDAFFGRLRSSRGTSAFPQVRAVYLVECGTHAIVDAGFWPCGTHERIGGHRMLRSLQPDMLLMWDRGFHSYAMVAETLQRGAQVLARFSMIGTPKIRQTLADGSALIELTPADDGRLPDAQPIQLRLITYHLTDPALGNPTEVHRVVTSLLDPVQYPAADLVCAYHERWEIEIVIDELDTHQRVVGRPLRSQQPVGVLQELYGLLIAHYLIRTVMHEAAVRGELDPDRISFVHAVRVIQDAIAESQMLDPDCLPLLYTRLLSDLRENLLPARRVRMYPRVIKQKMSRFLRKRPEHETWPQPTLPFPQAVAIIPDPLTDAPAKRPYRRSPRIPEPAAEA